MAIEIHNPAASKQDADNLRRRDANFAQLLRIAPAVERDKLPVVGILGPGTYKGAVLATGVDLDGTAAAVVDGPVVFQGTAMVRGVRFTGQVTVAATATVMLHGCTLLVPVIVAAGGKVGCVGCRFDGTAAITNAGVPGNANRVGCVGTSALAADAGVTITGGV